LDRKLESDVHRDVWQNEFPILLLTEKSNKPYEFPIIVTETDPEAGTFARILVDTTGASNVKTKEMVDDRTAVVTATDEEGIRP
jgi:hypothetical protein